MSKDDEWWKKGGSVYLAEIGAVEGSRLCWIVSAALNATAKVVERAVDIDRRLNSET